MHIHLITETKLENNAIYSRVYMKAVEHEPDHTTVEGRSGWKLQYTPGAGETIVSGSLIGLSGFTFDVRDENHDVKDIRMPRFEVGERYLVWADRDGVTRESTRRSESPSARSKSC